VALSEGGRWQTPVVVGEESSAAGARVLSAVLVLELLWLLLFAATVVFLAAHLSGNAEDFPADPVVRRVVLFVVPPVAVALGLALIGARQATNRRATSPGEPLDHPRRAALWITAAGNAAVVITILSSLYHAHTTWLVVGLSIAAGLIVVALACVHTARP